VSGVIMAMPDFHAFSHWDKARVKEVEELDLLCSAFTLALSWRVRKSPSRLRYMRRSVRIWRFQKLQASTCGRMP
jgi:hypothetical protein